MRELQSIGACHSQSNKKRFSMCSAQASIGSKFRSFWSAIDRSGFQPVIALLFVSSVFLFAQVLTEVRAGDIGASDRAILLAFRLVDDSSVPIGPPWLIQSAKDISALGGTTVISLLTAAAVGFLALHRQWRNVITLVSAVGGAAIVSNVMKVSLLRERPALALHLTDVWSFSFPSGHAMMAAATYLTFGMMLAHTQETKRARIYVVSLAVAMTVLIGVTRIYLGVHWPSDVVGGWFAGAAWALLFWIFMGTTPRSMAAH